MVKKVNKDGGREEDEKEEKSSSVGEILPFMEAWGGGVGQ